MIKSWLKRFDLKELRDSEFQTLDDVKEKLIYFRTISEAGIENLNPDQYENLKSEIKEYFYAWGYFENTLPESSVFYRTTVNKRITSVNEHYLSKISQLTGPPLRFLSNIGRCNGLEIPVFYASSDIKSAIFEAVPEVGDCITISMWRLKPNVKLKYHHIFHPEVTALTSNNKILFDEFIRAASGSSKKLADITSENLKFLTEEFIKPIEGRSSLNYIFSSLFSEFLFGYDISEPLDAIMYPSTKIQNGQLNIAIPDSIVHQKFDLIEVGFSRVESIWDTPEVPYRKIDMSFKKFEFTTNFNLTLDSIG